jgi:hypothetical protein
MRPALAALVALALSVAATANPLVGSWAAPGGPTMTVKADGTMTWNGTPYQLQGNALIYQGAQGAGMAEFSVQGDQVIMAGAEIGMVQLARVQAPKATPGRAPAPTPARAPAARPAAPAAPAAPPKPGDYVAKAFGFRMSPAPGWGHREQENAVLFGHDVKPGFLMLTIIEEHVTSADIQRVAREGYAEPGFSVKPVTPGKYAQVPTGQGEGYYFRVTGTMQGKPVAGFTGVFLPPNGQAILVMALTSPEKVGELEPDARAMLSSVRLTRAENQAIHAWDQELRGMRIQYMWSYGSSSPGGAYVGGSSNKDWHLCRLRLHGRGAGQRVLPRRRQRGRNLGGRGQRAQRCGHRLPTPRRRRLPLRSHQAAQARHQLHAEALRRHGRVRGGGCQLPVAARAAIARGGMPG